MMSRNEFEAAIKDALRYYARADLLAGNPLLHAQVMRRRGTRLDRAKPASNAHGNS